MKCTNISEGTLLPDAKPVNPNASPPKGKARKPVPTTVAAEEVLAAISATLSPPASELIRWYCRVTRHQEADAVEGAVFGFLSRACAAYAEDNRHDESFNWLLEDVLAGMHDETRHPVRRAYGGGYTVRLSIEASERLFGFTEAAGVAPGDAVNAAVLCSLEATLNNDNHRFLFGETIKHATQHRLAAEAARRRRDDAATTHHHNQKGKTV